MKRTSFPIEMSDSAVIGDMAQKDSESKDPDPTRILYILARSLPQQSSSEGPAGTSIPHSVELYYCELYVRNERNTLRDGDLLKLDRRAQLGQAWPGLATCASRYPFKAGGRSVVRCPAIQRGQQESLLIRIHCGQTD